jgi:excisionase family DNA binding protein
MALPLHPCFKKRQKLRGRKKMEFLLNKRFFRPDEVARLLALSRRTIYRMIRDGRLRAVRWGSGPWRIPQEALRAILPPDGQEI